MLLEELEAELHRYGSWWSKYSVDEKNGGFYGRIAHNNEPDLNASKCIILHARILWFFSEYAGLTGEPRFKELARRAFDYFLKHYWDEENQGVYWMLTAKGEVSDARKHIYAQAFAIYALASYFSLSKEDAAMKCALAIFSKIESHAFDQVHGGYWEAFDAQWRPAGDVRLSEKESNFPKTMNTHLHLLEAYTSLNECFSNKNTTVNDALIRLLKTYITKIVDTKSGHVRMFLDAHWQDNSPKWSFGHDIESSWLLLKAADSCRLSGIESQRVRECSEKLALECLQNGMQAGGFLGDEYHKSSKTFGAAAWWVQMEAMVGFAQFGRLTNNEQYWAALKSIWTNLKTHYYDERYGEFHWFPKSYLRPEKTQYKTGEWKGPYHTGRALLELRTLLG